MCNFGLFLSKKFVAMATFFAHLKIQIAYLNSMTQNHIIHRKEFLDFLHRTEISAILAVFA